MYGMNRILREIGWAAVAVDGFIPPNAFMEFQAFKILVIASDIRSVDQIGYTPAPDILHEAAGHAPIIANPDYAEYLRRFGEIGSKAITNKHDQDVYYAIRRLSELKEKQGSAADTKLKAQVEKAEAEVLRLQELRPEPSEMAMIRNLHWWTVEYGLIGTLDSPKIYGAGLLSSISESKGCLKPEVKKLPYSIEAAHREFDITTQQPQLYVTPDFAYLMEVLEEFAKKMAVRKGGHRGLKKLIDSAQLGTIELSTGLQVSGVFDRMIVDDDQQVVFFKTVGRTALSYRDHELVGHGTSTHHSGFLSPLGKLKGINLAIEDMGPVDLKAYNFYDNKRIKFTYDSGITVEGMNVTGQRNRNGKLMLIQFTDCTVTYQNEVLFTPADGILYLAVGKTIDSASAGAADPYSFHEDRSETFTLNPSSQYVDTKLMQLYNKVHKVSGDSTLSQKQKHEQYSELKALAEVSYPDEWLLKEVIEDALTELKVS